MTAEGDNSVLMQKVAKERLSMLAKEPIQLEKPSSTDLANTDYMVYLLKAREANLFNELGKSKFFSVHQCFGSALFSDS